MQVVTVPPLPRNLPAEHHQSDSRVGEGTDVMEQFDGTTNQGRKGIAYDWQSLYAEAQAATIDRELATIVPQFAD